MIELLIASNALSVIAVLLMATGVQKLYKAHAIENEAFRRELRTLADRGVNLASPRLSKIDFAPGDTLVLTTESFLTREQHAAIKGHLEATLPGLRAAVLTGGLQAVGVLASVNRA